MELTTEQKARVFAHYIGHPVQIMDTGKQENIIGFRNSDEVMLSGGFTPISDIRILLKPLSAITDEDAIEVAKIATWDKRTMQCSAWIGRAIAVHNYTTITPWDDSEHDTADHRKIVTELNGYVGALVLQFLIQRGYAVPLFYGVGHPFNGKNAIEVGLAIDSTTIQ